MHSTSLLTKIAEIYKNINKLIFSKNSLIEWIAVNFLYAYALEMKI